jgi:hypothetical protein
MVKDTVAASLPFPVRVRATPYVVKVGGVAWSLRFDRIQRSVPDERVAGPGTTADLEHDRHGQLAFSKVTGDAELEAGSEPVRSFLGALNLFITIFRDVLSEFWLRPLDIKDLYQLTVQVDGQGATRWSSGRAGGLMLAVVGLTDEAEAALQGALQRNDAPPLWRDMQLDAREALALGRVEQSVVLAWSCLESACRQILPAMAYRAGLSPKDLADRLESRARARRPVLSLEEAVERAGIQRVVQLTAELTDPQIFHSLSVTNSVMLVYHFRNKILHQGARLSAIDGQESYEAVRFVLEQALTLRDVTRHPQELSWRQHFGTASQAVMDFLIVTGLQLVLADSEGSAFSMELLGAELWVRIPPDATEPVTEALVLTQWDAWERAKLPARPWLQAEPPGDILQSGIVYRLAQEGENAVCFAEAAIAAANSGSAILHAADFVLSRVVPRICELPTMDPSDLQQLNDQRRQLVIPLQLAKYLVVFPPVHRQAILAPLDSGHRDIVEKALKLAAALAVIDPADGHSRCAAYLRIHATAMWFDTVQVICPVEKIAYGSRKRGFRAEGSPAGQ